MVQVLAGHHIPENEAYFMINEFGVIILIDELGNSMICQGELRDKIITGVYKWVQKKTALKI
jgi:hypothetical protein